MQYIDARDLAIWTLDAVEQGLGGPYNLVSPPGHTTMGELLEACVGATGSDADLVWTPPEKILEAGIQPWTDLPIWMPASDAYDMMHRASVAKALSAGLRCRSVQETVSDTWEWLQSIGGRAPQRPDRPVVGLAADKETQVLRG